MPIVNAPGLRRLKPLALAMLLWTAVAALMALAVFSDAVLRGTNITYGYTLNRYGRFFLPLPLFSWALYLAFVRWPESFARARNVLLLYVGVLVLFLPLYMTYQAALTLPMLGRPLRELWQRLNEFERYEWWINLMVVSAGFAAQVAIATWQRARARELAWREAQNENLNLRLALLQGQLEPHFLFNALNGISALVRGGDRATALRALARMSDLLRYALRASKHDWLPLADEIQFMRDYVELQRLRFGDQLQVQWDIQEDDWQRFACPPLLFQPLVENAMRHGLEADPAAGPIRIGFGWHGPQLMLELANPRSSFAAAGGGHGIGLASTRQRLRMLYGDAATLETLPTDERFTARLVFPARPLAEHDA
jgi:sensor histidine kinase YesM